MKRIIRSAEEPNEKILWKGYPSRAVVEEITDAAEEHDFDADYTICWRFPEDSPLIRKYDLKPIPGEAGWYYSPNIKYEHIYD